VAGRLPPAFGYTVGRVAFGDVFGNVAHEILRIEHSYVVQVAVLQPAFARHAFRPGLGMAGEDGVGRERAHGFFEADGVVRVEQPDAHGSQIGRRGGLGGCGEEGVEQGGGFAGWHFYFSGFGRLFVFLGCT